MKKILLNLGIVFALIGCNASMNKVSTGNSLDVNQREKKEDSTVVVSSDVNQGEKKEDSTVVVSSDVSQRAKKEDSAVVVSSDVNQGEKKEDSTVVVSSDVSQREKKEKSTMVLSNDEKLKALYEKTISLIKSEDFENAYKNLEEISSLCTNANKELLGMCAKSSYNKGVIEENNNKSATESYEQALKYDFKDKTKIYNKLAYSYYNESKFKQALPYLLKINNFNDVTINYMIGFSYIKLNKKSFAKEFILRAKNSGNKNAENLWFKHELYGY